MRRYLMVLILAAVLLSSCASMGDILFPPTSTLGPSATPTITVPPSATATITNTPVPTATITIVHIPTVDPNQPTSTFAPIPVIIEGGITATPLPVNLTPTVFKPGQGFLSVSISDNKIFWGSCKHNKTTITAVVEDDEEAFSVVIFTYVRAANKDDSTPWTTGNVMHDHGDGTYTYVMRGSDVEGHNHYKNSWIVFQLVVTNVEGQEIGRTRIYDNSIALSPCQ
ncbi:MAG: hypothetical protein JNM55_15790 [Anaerolineales bacterium]|nr:hypothetical protein [Anaerolineales bacterium]